jgi:DNA excision repair protein ERCC-2
VVEWCFRSGNLGSERSFTGPQRAIRGVRGHQEIQQSRPPEYRPEVMLEWAFEAPDHSFRWTLRGRADGIWPQDSVTLIEEIKTVTPRWKGQPSEIHWAQGKIYAAIICLQQPELTAADVQLTYLEIESGLISVFRDSWTRQQLLEFIDEAAAAYTVVLERRRIWESTRTHAAAAMKFPFDSMRPGQDQIIREIDQAVSRGGIRFIQAPTGLGKTVATLFPVLQRASRLPNTTVFFLTAKNSNKANAEKALNAIRAHGGRVRSVTLGASGDWCHSDTKPCDILNCPLALGYFDRCRDAILDLEAGNDHWTKATVKDHGLKHGICPAALSHEMTGWADVIIADYNHALDPRAALREFFAEDHNRSIILLIDEAHNLPDRARKMFGSEIRRINIEQALRQLPGGMKACRQALDQALANWPIPPDGTGPCKADEPGGALLKALRDFREAAERWLILNESTPFREALMEAYFQVYDFLQNLQTRSDSDYFLESAEALEILCLDPGPRLEKAFRRVHSVIFFSATLNPPEYYERWLCPTLPHSTLSLPSPYPPENLQVWIETGTRTQWRSRTETAPRLARLLMRFATRVGGSLILYFPSYDYLELIHSEINSALPPDVFIHTQKRQSGPAEQQEFLDFLTEKTTGAGHTRIGLAVLGGLYAEGIDLPNGLLRGVAVVGIGMPQISLERDLIRDHFAPELGTEEAFATAYIYPGITKVIQAVGRLIRSDSDTGTALLVDTRYAGEFYQSLLPSWWEPGFFVYRPGKKPGTQ